jgi:putative nucleotidyltransferase with HDIG domain
MFVLNRSGETRCDFVRFGPTVRGLVKVARDTAEIRLVIGSLVGGYRVVTGLGGGPSGQVYYAEHPVIGRRAAIKVLAPALTASPERLDRFITHLKIVSSIRHPNIVDVLDIGQMPPLDTAGGAAANLTFFVMEMLEGEALDERLERERVVDERTAVRILVQIAAAVGAAHDRGLVHAALKAKNIFITNSADYPDFVKVLDFGAYKLRVPRSIDETAAPYLAPEVLAGGEPDSAADIYSVGILAYQMLVGGTPWQREHEADVPAGERRPPLPPHERREGITPALSAAIMRALATDPDQRWPTLRDFRRAIERAVTPDAAAIPAAATAAPTALPASAGPATAAEIQRTERVQARKVGRALSNIILRRINENRLQLPSMPLVALKCLDVLGDPNVTFADVAKIIEQDPVIATRTLRVVNSAAYSRRHAVKTLEQAVSQIGVKPMRILLVEVAACQVFTSRSAGIRQKFKLIWEHCLAVGMLSRDLADRLGSRVEPDVAYLGGLLHDIGKPIVGGLLLEAERKLIEELDVPWMTETLWQKTVAESHRSIGAAVAVAWKLPPDVAQAVQTCDAYDRDAGPHSCGNIVRFANTLAKREGIYVGDVSGEEIIAAILQGRDVLNVDEKTETALIAALRERTGAVTAGPSSRETDRLRRARLA